MPRLPTSPFVLLEDSKSRNRADAGLLFQQPRELLVCDDLKKIPAILSQIPDLQKQGFFLAGWFSYECAFAFHPTLKNQPPQKSDEPLIWLGVFDAPQQLSSEDLDHFFTAVEKQTPTAGFQRESVLGENFNTFEAALAKIQAYISAGDIYQVNHTFRMALETFGDAFTLYAGLRNSQPVPFGAIIDTGDWRVLSFSPELFITRRGNTLMSSPMKGTASAGVDFPETQKKINDLANDKKNRAENLMITDLIRNDFSRVCDPGSVRVENMFAVTRFSRVLQMTSDVKGTLKPQVSFPEIFRALFPCGSVTGAPKIRAMEIIQETESSPRGLYTGALGCLMPNYDFTFNVPIRTAVLNKFGQGWMGIGSGVIADSKINEEYAECKLKGDFLFSQAGDFALIETLYWEPDNGFAFLAEHLARLEASAKHFGFQSTCKEIEKMLNLHKAGFSETPQKVRVLCQANGAFTIENSPASAPGKSAKKIKLTSTPINSRDPFLFHKTTNRRVYDERKREAGDEYYDVIFWNERGEITEGSYNNVFVKTEDGQFLTPEKKCGLLPGIFRAHLLKNKQVKEGLITRDDLKKAKKIFLGNAVSGFVEVSLKP